jgi:hypothetical protein
LYFFLVCSILSASLVSRPAAPNAILGHHTLANETKAGRQMNSSATLALGALALSACVAQNSAPKLASAPPPDSYRENVAEYVRESFMEPDSITDAAISSPLRKTGSMYWNPSDPPADWYVCLRARTKAILGGYTKPEVTIVLFRSGDVVGAHTKPDAGPRDVSTDHFCANAKYSPFPEIEERRSQSSGSP